MLKTVLFAVVAMTMLTFTAGVKAEDDLLSDVANLKASSISDADNTIQDDALAGVDVEGLASKAGSEKSGEAIEACFRRFGWGGGCYNNYSYGYGCYNYGYNYGCYNYCYSPCYSYNYCYRPCYQTYIAYQPVCYQTYSYCQPLYTWGCY